MTISLGRQLPDGSSGVPGSSAGRVNGTCFALHRTGFGEPPCHHGAGGLLPHLFTLTGAAAVASNCPAVSFLCHFPSAFAVWGFPSVLPYGVRTSSSAPPERHARGHKSQGSRLRTDAKEPSGSLAPPLSIASAVDYSRVDT